MNRRMKRSHEGVIVLWLIMFLMLGVNVGKLEVHAETLTSGDYEYVVLDDGTVEITDYTGKDSVVEIPDTIDDRKVTSIGGYAFSDCSGLTSVNIPEGVTSIEDFAFDGCDNLISVTMPDSVTHIGAAAFSECSGLTSVTIPGSVESIGSWAFISCTGLTNVTIEEGVASIGQDAFSGCSGLTSVTIPESVTKIGMWAFFACSGLTEICIAETNPEYSSEDGVLFNKDKSELICYPGGKKGEYTIPESVTRIERDAFKYSSGLTGVTIQGNVESIGWYAFSGCSGLTSVTIPGNVTSIGLNAFENCTGLTSVTIGEGVTSIGTEVFKNCSSLTGISVAEMNPKYSSEDGVLFNKDKSWLACYPSGKKGDYYIPESVTGISEAAFSGCSELTSVSIPESVTEMIWSDTFKDCSGLVSIHVAETNPEYSSEDGVLFNKDKSWLKCYPRGKQGDYTVPGSVTEIGYDAFYGCDGLMNVTILENVTEISSAAFKSCSSLTLRVVKDSYAEQYAKENDIPYQYIETENTDNTTTEVPNEPTAEQPTTEQPVTNQPAEEEEKVVVGNVTMIPVDIETDEKPVVDDKVEIQSGSKTIKKGTILTGKAGIYKVTNVKKKTVAYMGIKNKKASSVKVPEEIKIKKKKYKVTSVSASAFRNNKKIKTVTIGQNVKEIGKNAFRGCKNLKKVTIGKNVTTIGNYAFYGCKKLNLIEIRSSKLKKVGKAAFKKIAKQPTARVPKGKIQSYKKLLEGKM
ncbi:MAG: leucine-rich repeat domain-containing protein [Clostridium sp.]|nr:leucine-rich repeat domain-containing protein [Clostridium sp.]